MLMVRLAGCMSCVWLRVACKRNESRPMVPDGYSVESSAGMLLFLFYFWGKRLWGDFCFLTRFENDLGKAGVIA